MKIGELVWRYAPAIFASCQEKDPGELLRLQDRKYSKETLDANFPFCKPLAEISREENRRYWSKPFDSCGVSVRVTSQWFDPPTSKSRPRLMRYLERLGIEVADADGDPQNVDAASDPHGERKERPSRGRYRGNAVGNAQNLLVRNLLSNIGSESFGLEHWEQVIDAFDKRCAYCGQEGEVLIDHVVPINKQTLGEHRLGNLVPSCRACNSEKADTNFRDFLSGRPERIQAIEGHMKRHNYEPIGDNPQIRQIVELAHKEVGQVARRYIEILNMLIAESR